MIRKTNLKKTLTKDMYFYGSMMDVHAKSQIDLNELIKMQLCFWANPNKCSCGHEWSVFDLMNEAIEKTAHDWDFFRQQKFFEFPESFVEATSDLNCPKCNTINKDIRLMYNYGGLIYGAC